MKGLGNYLILMGGVLLFSGCSRYICWIQKNFAQADHVTSALDRARAYLKSTAVYDRFATIALIDALWLSPEVKEIHRDMYYAHWGAVSPEREAGLLTFYVLLAPDEGNYIVARDNRRAQWSVSLDIDGTEYRPLSVERVTLDPEYTLIFERHFSRFMGTYIFDEKYLRFKGIYRLLFQENLTSRAKNMRLLFRTVRYHTELSWCLDEYLDCPGDGSSWLCS